MKKNVLIVIIGLLLSACIASAGLSFSKKDVKDSPNLVMNPSFEISDDSTKVLKGWTIMDETAKKYVSLTDDEHFKGKKSVEIKNPNLNVLLISDAFEIDSAGGYYSFCHLKSLNKSEKKIEVFFFAFNKNGKRKDRYRERYKISQNWKEYEISSGFFDKSVKYGRIIISLPKNKNQIHYLDDVESFKVYKFHK